MDALPAEDLIFENGAFKMDIEKNLFKREQNKYVLIQKLKKAIRFLAIYENKPYFIDTFGDCYAIEKEIRFLFGVLCNPSYFTVGNGRIYALDKYSRMWVCDLDGEILNIAFLRENIMKAVVKPAYCSVITDGNGHTVGYRNPNGEETSSMKERQLLVCDRSFTILKKIAINKVVEFREDAIAYEADDGTSLVYIHSFM